MLYKKTTTKITIAVLLSVFCFTAFLSIAAIAINLDGWYKSSTGGNYIQINVDDIDFLVIKQADGAVIWTKQTLSISEQEDLLTTLKEPGYDPSLDSCKDGVVITSLTSFILKDVLGFTGTGGKYNAVVTVAEENGMLILTINGDYSHYAYGRYEDETTIIITDTTPPLTNETSAEQTDTTPPLTNETSAELTDTTPPLTNETSAEQTDTTPPLTNETSAEQTDTTPPETVITDPPPPLISDSSYVELTTFEPPYTGDNFDMRSISVVMIAALMFGSISGIAILLHILKKSNVR